MNIDLYILAFSAVTVLVTIWMGFRSAKKSKTASDFFVAGRSVGVGMNASAISGEYLSAASFMGIAGMVMSSGYDALWYPVCYACGYLFLLLFIAGPLRRFGAYTIPDFAEGRFDSPVFRKIAVVFVLFIGFFYTMPQMKGAGTTLAYIFPGLPYWAGVVLVGAVITLNVALGGMKGITLVQAFQYWAKMFAISVPIFVLMAVYGHYGKQLGVNGVETYISSYTPSGQLVTVTNSSWLGEASVGSPRAVLPAKAPRDPTWLNPFGPLTTKAAKNAAAAIGKKAEKELSREGAKGAKENTPSTSPFAGFAASRETTPLRAGLSPEQRMTVPLDSLPLTQALGVYAELTGRQLLPNTNSLVTRADDFLGGKLSALQLVHRPRPPDTGVREHGDGAFTAAEVKEAIENLIQQQGFELRPHGKTSFALLKTSKTTMSGDGDESGPISGVAANLSGGTAEASGTATKPSSVTIKASGTTTEASGVTTNPNGTTTKASGNTTKASDRAAYLLQPSSPLAASSLRQAVPSLNQGAAPAGQGMESAAAISPAAIEKAWLAKHEKPLALLYTYSLIIAIVCGTAGLPHILVRFYTNPDGVAAKKTTMWVMILIGVFYVFPPVFGVIGRNLLPDLYNGIGAKGTDKIVLELPRILNEKYAPLGSVLSGITCAGAFAAFMSTFSGLLVSMTGALAHDVYGRILRPKSTPEQRMRMFKIGAVLIGGVAIVLGSFVEPLEINFMVGQAFAIAAASYFPLLFMAVWWRKLTMKGAAIGMLTGGVCALVAAALTNFSNLASDKGPMGKIFSGFAPLNDFWAAHPLLRILCEQPAIWAVPLAITLMIVVSKLTAKTIPADSRMKMLVLHAPEQLGLKQEYIQEHQPGH